MKPGPAFEAKVVEYLRHNGFPWAERRVMGGTNDRGDVSGVPAWVLECKRCRRMELAAWIDQAADAAINAGVDFYAVVHWRQRAGDPAEQYVTMPLKVFAALAR